MVSRDYCINVAEELEVWSQKLHASEPFSCMMVRHSLIPFRIGGARLAYQKQEKQCNTKRHSLN